MWGKGSRIDEHCRSSRSDPWFWRAINKTLLIPICICSSYFEQNPNSSLCWNIDNRRKYSLIIYGWSQLLNMNVTFDLAKIEMMPQQARKQLETELETTCCSLGGVPVCIQQFWSVQSSPVQSSPVQSSPVQSNPIQSSPAIVYA